jgi:hypothetical protein
MTGSLPITLEQMKRYALCRLLPNTRHAAQAIYEANQ